MKKVQEYKILPQAEHDRHHGGSSYPGDEYNSGRNNCLGSFLIVLTAILILVGTAALIVTAFWSKEFHSTLDLYWPNHPISGHHSQAIWLEQINSTVRPTIKNSTQFPSKHNSSSSEEFGSGEDFGHNGTDIHKNGTEIEINKNNIGIIFTEAMRNLEKKMETISGIHQAELVIPLFMLVTFMSTLALISFCCCLMSKRREGRQRKLLGKIITDLQTGDSKTVLLGGKDEDF